MVSAEELFSVVGVVLPTVLGVAMVLATVALVFWVGSGKKRSYEEAKAQASRKAEEVLREREQASPKAKKLRKNFRKKKEHQDETESALPRKGILKTTSPGPGVDTTTSDRASPKVEFKLDSPAKEAGAHRANPTTPYPNKDTSLGATRPAVVKTPQPIFEEEEIEEIGSVQPEPEATTKKKQGAVEKPTPPPAQKLPTQVTQKPPQSVQNPQAHVGKPEPAEQVVIPKEAEVKRKPSGTSAQKRVKGNKSKLVVGSGGTTHDTLPASRVEDIVTASSLTDEEIQAIIELLLEKSNANSEWEAPNLKIESNKSLKRQNQELQTRLEEATQSSVSLSNKIKELRKEVQGEKTKHQSAEISLQSKLNQQGKDLAIYRARSSGLEEELKRMKSLESQHLQKLREENSLLSSQVQQQQAALSTQLQSSRAVQAPNGAGAGMREKVAEQEKIIELKTREIEQLTANGLRLQTQLQSMNEVCNERDELKQRLGQLESNHAQLAAEVQQTSADKDGSLAHIGALQEDLQKVRSTAAQEKAELQVNLQGQHQVELEKLRKELAELEGLRECAAKLETQGKQLTELEGRNRQLAEAEEKSKQLASQADSRNSQLEEKVKTLEVQLEAEKSSKKDLMAEMDHQTKAVSNGPVAVETLSNSPDNQPTPDKMGTKEVTILEKKLEDLKCKNDELSESLWQAKQDAGEAENKWEEKLKQVREQMEQRVSSAKSEAFLEACDNHSALLQQLFPEVSVEGGSDGACNQKWLEEFERKAQDILDSKKEESAQLKENVRDLERQKEENLGEILQFRETLEKTMNILAELQTKVDCSNREHQLELKEKEIALEKEVSSNQCLQGELGQEKALVTQVREELNQEKALVCQVREELNMEKALVGQVKAELGEMKESVSRLQEELGGRGAEEGVGKEEVARLQDRLQQMEQSRTAMDEQVGELQAEVKEKKAALDALELRVAAESRLKEDAIKKSDELEVAKKDVAERLEVMKQSNRELNSRLSSMIAPSPTDSEV